MSKNELRQAVSPYLLQHADNPVHWRQWGPDALAEAKAADKPILLSIGYAACHWCHVMAHESFEHEPTAALMNDLFVNIKVDREERPDIDHFYMSSLHLLGEQGGWPLTMFLTPNGEPFWGGTYFPRDARYGRPSFRDVLRSVSTVYTTQGDKVAHNAAAIRQHLLAPNEQTPAALTDDYFSRIGALLADAIDPNNGGLKGAPKFPNPTILEAIWRTADHAGNESMREKVLFTLERMCRGGIFDQLGGGFARYSVDARWLVPHFEKMLYDNAQLLDLLSLAWSTSRRPIFARAAHMTVGWMLREMRNVEGAFCASLDADSDGVEGKFYVWTYPDVMEALGLENGAGFAKAYDIRPEGNWRDEHTGQSVSVLNRLDADSDDDAAWEQSRALLFNLREQRPRPQRDDKILADWNGLAIGALARAAATFSQPEWLAAARSAYHFVRDSILPPDGSERWHAWRAGVHSAQALALDYATMADAALALAETVDTPDSYIADAQLWLNALWQEHANSAGLIAMSSRTASDILLRLSPTQDDAIPNVHGIAIKTAVRLHTCTGDEKWLARADALLAAASSNILANPAGHAGLLNAFDFRQHMLDIVVIAPSDHELAETARNVPALNRTVRIVSSARDLPAEHPLTGFAEIRAPTAFVCAMDRCSAPAISAGELLNRISSFSSLHP